MRHETSSLKGKLVARQIVTDALWGLLRPCAFRDNIVVSGPL